MRFVNYCFILILILSPATVLAQTDTSDSTDSSLSTDSTDTSLSTDTTDDVTITVSLDTATSADAKASTPAVPKNIEDAAENVNILVEAAEGGQWALFFGVLLTLLVWLSDKLFNVKARIGSKALPWVAAVSGIAATVGVALTTGLPVGQAIIQGFITGASAVGLWELIFKHSLKTQEPAV